mmetsp:Transcript_115358/g.366845  ORF Transcript_115358/g.366845 Transcript_115358/m.366845 type:complete len:204 (+) Transcript_115358:496-1107(+)
MPDHIRREARPTLAVVPAVFGVREGQMLHQMRHVCHPRIQRLIPAAGLQLQATRHPGHQEAALGVAAALEGLVIVGPTVALHLDGALDPSNDLCLVALALEEREGAVALIEPQHRVGVDAFLAADRLEVHAIHLDEAHPPLHAVPVREELGGRVALAIGLVGKRFPLRGELSAMTAPTGKEVDEGVVMSLDHMLEAAVVKAVV